MQVRQACLGRQVRQEGRSSGKRAKQAGGASKRGKHGEAAREASSVGKQMKQAPHSPSALGSSASLS